MATKKSLPTLLLEAERAFDEKYLVNSRWGENVHASADSLKSHFRDQILSILSEAERATEVEEKPIEKVAGMFTPMMDAKDEAFNSALSQVKPLWREFRGNLK